MSLGSSSESHIWSKACATTQDTPLSLRPEDHKLEKYVTNWPQVLKTLLMMWVKENKP